MKIAFVILMLTAGGSVSFILLRESSKRIRDSETLFELSSFIEARIRIAATPISEIIGQFNASRDKKESAVGLELLTENDDPEIRRLADGICRLDLAGARSQAELLKNYTERKLQGARDDASRGRRVRIVLPAASFLLIALMLI